MSHYDNQNCHTAHSYGQDASPASQHHEEVDLDNSCGHNNSSSQWDSRVAIPSFTIHSNHSMQSINEPYEQQPGPGQQIPIVDYSPTHTDQSSDSLGDTQRTYTQRSSRFSSAREKFMKLRVRHQFTHHSEITHVPESSLRSIYLILFGSQSSLCPCRMAIWLLMSRSRRILSLLRRRARNSAPCGYVATRTV